MIQQKYVKSYLQAYKNGSIRLNKRRIKLVELIEKTVLTNENYYFDEEKRSFKLTAKKIKKCYETDGYILLSTACQRSYKIYTFPFIENYLCEDGKSVVLHNEQTGRVGLSNLRLNKEIISIFDSLTPEEKPKDTWVQSVNI